MSDQGATQSTEPITEKEAMDIISKIQGTEGIFAAAEKFKQQIESAKSQKANIEARLVGYNMVVEILNRLAIHWGIKKLDLPVPLKPNDAALSENGVSKETTDRIAKGQCLYKDKQSKKWCNRRLKTKKEKEGR